MIEEHIIKLTEALNANTLALNKILEAGAVADTATSTPEAAEPAKKRNKKTPEAPKGLGDPYEETPAPVVEETPEPAPAEEPVVGTPVTEVPDLPITELRDSLKQLIKKSLEDRPTTRDNFDSLREKYGIKLLKDLTDDQVSEFYKEVLTW